MNRARGGILRLIMVMTAAATLLAAAPSPSPLTGDPRTPGEGPGLVGDPLLAIGLVLLIAVGAIVATTVWVRMTGGPKREGRPPR